MPEKDDLDGIVTPFEREIIKVLREIRDEIHGQREDQLRHPNYEMSSLMLDNMRRQMGAVLPVQGIIKPSH